MQEQNKNILQVNGLSKYFGGLAAVSNCSLNIKKGSIGLALNQTCIYPTESPGGWNIIGITPIELFNLQSNSPCFSKPGDKIQFVEISKSQYVSSLKNPDKPDFIEL